MRAVCLIALVLVAMIQLGASGVATVVDAEMRNVDLHLTPEITVHVHHLRGKFIPEGARQAPNLDDPRSYRVAIDTGEVAIDLDSLNALMTRTLKGHSNVRSLRVTFENDGRIRQQGSVSKGIPVPFDVTGTAGVTPNGLIRIHAESVKGFGIPVKPLLKALSVEMDDLLTIDPGRGVTVEGNDLLLDPASLLPPPAMRGTITSVRIEHGMMVQVFGSGTPRPLAPAAAAKNYIYWRGGQLTFGKLTMADTDLELVDDDPGDPFDFSVDRWNEQLVAGYSKVTGERGLKAHMPDYNDVTHAGAAPRDARR